MKKLLVLLLALSLLLTGCNDSGSQTAESQKIGSNELTDTSESEDKIAVINSNESNSKNSVKTVLDLKKKYGTDKDKAIMPMYNVAYDEVFTFKFNADLSEVFPNDVISVHTDAKALEESEIFYFANPTGYSSGPTTLEVKPGVAVLATDDTNKGLKGWGNAPIYYIRINYDLDAIQPTKLDKPIIIPFTIKSDVEVPTLDYEIDPKGRLKLVWDPIEGATEYNIYQISNIRLLETSNEPLRGAETGYVGLYPRLIGTVKETEFDQWLPKSPLDDCCEDLNTLQNQGVQGEYFITAVKGDKESNFSNSVNTPALSDKLPLELESDVEFTVHETIASLPKTVDVKLINGKIIKKDVYYETNIEIKEDGRTTIRFTIPGTAFMGYVYVKNITEEDLIALERDNPSNTTSAMVKPQNNTDYVPSPDVATVIEDTETASADKEKKESSGTEDEKSKDTTHEEQQNTDLHSFVKKLISLRKNETAFGHLGQLHFLDFNSNTNHVMYKKTYKNETILFTVNNSEQDIEVQLPTQFREKNFVDLLSTDHLENIIQENHLKLRPYGFSMLKITS